MTKYLYYVDSYIQSFSAIISDIDPDQHGVILDQTAFYPGGGGQPADNGHLLINEKTIEIAKAKKSMDQVIHILPESEPLPQIGKQVTGQLNWERRYQLMRTHTAMHILCGVIFRDYGATVTGGDMDPLKARMDFEFETLHKDLIEKIERSINTEIQNSLDVRTEILPREAAFQIPDLIRTKINLLPEGIQEVRTVEIVGLDLQADGGTHVKNTAEVGKIKIIDYKSKGKINKRIYVEIQ